jgi:hypothetical protein
MAELNLTINLPNVSADQIATALATVASVLGSGTVAISPNPAASKDPDEFITLMTAAEECPLSSYCLRERIVEKKEIPYSRKSPAKKSPIIIKRKHLWLLFPDLAAGKTPNKSTHSQASSHVTAEDIALGNC